MTQTKSLNPLDASWLLVESNETPMHVGGLIRFSLPDDAPADYLRTMMADFRTAKNVAPPWNCRLRRPGLKGLMPVWEEIDDIDLEHHLHLSALPTPGGERELGQLIARLHSQPLDLTRPPWECELIEGLENRQFALYIKMHHSLIDGISGMKLLARSLSFNEKDSRNLPPFWTVGLPKRLRQRGEKRPPTAAGVFDDLMTALKGQASTVPDIVRAFGAMFSSKSKEEALAIPFDTPVSILNGRINSPRRFATQQFEIARLKAVADAASCTLNDVVLALCGAALRRFLLELDELPNQALTAGIPVSVRPKDDEGAGNAITFIISTLGTDIEDPTGRLIEIRNATRRAKEHVLSLPKKAMMQYTIVLMAPYMLSLLTGIGGRTRPMFNVTISNVPGPDQPLYFRGARMEATYPVSLVTHGQALNITCQSYNGVLHFGFTACRDAVPRMQRLATYTGDALAELEKVLLAPETPARSAGKARKPARKAANETTAPTADVPSPPAKRAGPAKPPARTSTKTAAKPARGAGRAPRAKAAAAAASPAPTVGRFGKPRTPAKRARKPKPT